MPTKTKKTRPLDTITLDVKNRKHYEHQVRMVEQSNRKKLARLKHRLGWHKFRFAPSSLVHHVRPPFSSGRFFEEHLTFIK